MQNKILIIDLETTGFNPADAEIVEIGIVSLDLETGEKEILFDKIIKPEKLSNEKIKDSWIVRNGYMKAEEIINSNPISYYVDEVQTIFDSYKNGLTAYNNKFDFGFLDFKKFKYKKLDCPMLISINVCRIPGRYGGYKWPSVQEAYDFFFPDSNYTEKHRGADDAFHEADIVYELYKMGLFKI